MKHFLLKTVALAFIFAGGASANTETKTLAVGDSLILTAADGYKTYQWQVSTDGRAYFNLPDETAKELRTLPYTPNYYRLKATRADDSSVMLDTTKVDFAAFTIYRTSDISAAQGYVEVDGQPGSGISIPGDGRKDNVLLLTNKLSNWSNANAHAVYYMCSPSGKGSLSMLITANNNTKVQFRLKVYNPAAPEIPLIDTYISFYGTGSEQEIPIYTHYRRSRYAYLRYDLECLSGNTAIQNINRWRFHSGKDEISYAPAYLSSPSVHLGSWNSTHTAGTSTSNVHDWCYQEIMIPESSDYAGTYAMSLGVLKGYMGIQVNGKNNHDVIFSIWDDGSTDENPGLASFRKAGAVDAAPYVTVSRFANEGTGAKTFVSGEWWKPGRFVQFITNSRPETSTYVVKDQNGNDSTFTRNNTLVSAWFNPLDGNGWKYIATVRLPGSGMYFNSWYSFLENYSWTSGQVERKAYYRNGYKHNKDSKRWFHCNQVAFGNTDGGDNLGARKDFGQGRDTENPNTFFMTSGGYTATNKRENTVELNTSNLPVDTISVEKLLSRVDEAIAREDSTLKAAAELQASKYDKTGWEVVSFSSQETSGEGTNGRAAQIIDGNTSTYWHSAWQSGNASFPHTFVVDMKQSQPVNGFEFTLSGGNTRYQKGIEVYGSKNNVTWTKVYENNNCPSVANYYLSMDSTATMRYFKLVIKTTQTGQVHTRINEIEVTHPIVTGVLSPIANANNSLMVYPSPATSYINVVAPADASDMLVSLYTLHGASILTQHVYDQQKGEVTKISLPSLPNGTYVVRTKIGENNYSRLIIIGN